jgi:DNA-binding FadR family transcriptional regulator
MWNQLIQLTFKSQISLQAQIREMLVAAILDGHIPVGVPLPSTRVLAQQLGVARNTVREAVRALAHNGLLDIRQGSGTYVLATSELAGVMHRRFADADQEQVAELRASLETSAAGLAAARRTGRDLELLEAALARREAAWSSGDPEAFVQADAAFHQAVVAAAHNDVFSAVYADLGEVMRAHLRHDVGPELIADRYVGHGGILDAIRAGDPQRASLEAGRAIGTCRAAEA